MAIVKQGDALTTKMIQPGGVYQTDGYGLLTGRTTYMVDKGSGGTAVIGGQVHPTYSDLFVHKFTLTKGALDLDTIDAEYVGIDSAVVTTRTNPNVTASTGLNSEHITTHPNFFEVATPLGFSGSPIAGVGTGSIATPAYPAVAGTSPTEYAGNNGATFEAAIGRKFLGFKKPEFKDFYGKTNYLAPQCSLSGVFYTSSSALVINLRNAVGKTSGNGSFASKDLVPSYMGTAFEISGKKQLLLAQVSFEDFGLLYKVQYELRFNREGYVSSVYAPAS
jgi:hypothetical protein